MKLGIQVGLGPGHTVSDGDPAPPRKGAQFACAVSAIFLLPVSVYALVWSRLSPFCNLLHQILPFSAVTVAFDVKRRSLTLFLVLAKPEVVF